MTITQKLTAFAFSFTQPKFATVLVATAVISTPAGIALALQVPPSSDGSLWEELFRLAMVVIGTLLMMLLGMLINKQAAQSKALTALESKIDTDAEAFKLSVSESLRKAGTDHERLREAMVQLALAVHPEKDLAKIISAIMERGQ